MRFGAAVERLKLAQNVIFVLYLIYTHQFMTYDVI